jgi:hypothetical protein
MIGHHFHFNTFLPPFFDGFQENCFQAFIYSIHQHLAALLLFILLEVSIVFVVVCKKFVTVEANILANVNTDQKIIARHVGREDQVFINLFNELGQVSLVKLSLQNERTMNRRRGKVDVYGTQAAVTLQAITLHDVIALRRGSSEVSFKTDIVHRICVAQTAKPLRAPFSFIADAWHRAYYTISLLTLQKQL